jgi:peptidyl-prolyl cis-trans isomerase C
MRKLSLVLFLLFTSCSWMRPSLGKKIVLDVDGKQLTGQEFAQELAYRLKDQDALTAKDPKTVALIKAKISEDFVIQALSEEWAREKNLMLKKEILDQAVTGMQKNYPDDLAFRQALADQGLTFKAWTDRLQQSLLQKLVVTRVVAGAPKPSESEVQAYYNEHRDQFTMHETAQIRQILVATESDAKAIETELKQGKKLTELAKKYSISPEGPSGGNVGWLEKGVSEVFEPAFRMKVGQRSPIVKSSFGYHIFELVARKPARSKPLNEVKGEIERIFMEKRQQSLYLAWLEEQTRKARVFKDQAFIDALKVETKTQ